MSATIDRMFIGLQNVKEDLHEMCWEFILASWSHLSYTNYSHTGITTTHILFGDGVAQCQYHLIVANDELRGRASKFHYEWIDEQRVAQQRKANLREKIRAGLRAPNQQTWRYQGLCQSAVIRQLRENKINGEIIRDALRLCRQGEASEIDAYALRDALNTLKQSQRTDLFHRMCDEDSDLRDYWVECEKCGDIEFHDDATHPIDGRYDVICESCLGNDYVFSELDDGWIRSGYGTHYYTSIRNYRNGDSEECLDSSAHLLYWCDSERVYFSDEDDAITLDDENRYDSSGYLCDYHCGRPYGFFDEVTTHQGDVALGVELEVEAQDERSDLLSDIRAVYPKDTLLLERDGSLDDERGFEIVTRPYNRATWDEFGPRLLSNLRNWGTNGYDTTSDEEYGIHVNVHRRHLSPLAEARIMMFLCAEQNATFVRAIAQRKSLYNQQSTVGLGITALDRQKVNVIGGTYVTRWQTDSRGALKIDHNGNMVKKSAKLAGAGKYAPINWKSDDDIAEFRLFNSTLNTVSFMKNLEFVWALIKWTKPEAATGSGWFYEDFLRWLVKPENRKEFPHLIKYLTKSTYRIKDMPSVTSQWKHIVTMAETEDDVMSEAA